MGELITSNIEEVVIQPLKQIEDERGAVLHMLRSDSPLFLGFGEIYFSVVNPGAIKAWKRHKKMTQHFAVPVGRIQVVIYDDRSHSPTCNAIEELILGRPDRYFLVRIPPLLWYGFQGIAEIPSLLANCTDEPHDPEEAETLDVADGYIPHEWKKC